MSTSSQVAVCYNVFYDPSLALHRSRGWQLSQLVQGKVATLTASRFVVRVPATVADGDDLQKMKTSVGSSSSDSLRGLTVAKLKKLIVDEYNAKLQAAVESRKEGCVTELVDESLATLSWGSTLLAPEESPISDFGLTSRHEGATLVLETYSSWAERLNAISFAAADPKNKKNLGGIPEELPTDRGSRVALAKEAKSMSLKKEETRNDDVEREDRNNVSSASSFTTSDDEETNESHDVSESNQGPVTLKESRIAGRPADRELVRQAMEARLASQQREKS